MQQFCLVLTCLLFSVPLWLVDAYESSAVQSANTETAYAAQQVHAAESQTDARNQSAMQSAEVKAAQQVPAADSHAAQAQSLMKAAEGKASRAKATAAQAQLAEKTQAAQGAKQVYAAQNDAGNAGAAERAEHSHAAEKIAFLSHKAATHVYSAQSDGASARSAQTKTEAKLSFPLLAPPKLSVVSSLLAAFPVLAILYFLMKKTPKGRAFTDRMSERISGIIPDRKKPLLSKSYQNLQCSKCFKSVPDQMTICVNHSMFTSNCIDGYSALCPAHKDLVGCSQKYCALAPPHLQVGTEVQRPAQKAVMESVPEHAMGA